MDRIKQFEPIFGEWYAESFIGEGSFGRVYKIYRDELGNRFYSALKHISIPQNDAELSSLRANGFDEKSIADYYGSMARSLSSETALMNKLRGNTNIVSFEDSRIIQKPDGMGYDVFIRMELLQSITDTTAQRTLSRKETAALGIDICKALSVCAKQGIIHRDIKPANIFISQNGDYKLGDFGIARQLEKVSDFMSKKGTYNYMAPEVYKGEEYGHACDIYSLGMVMYSQLNGGRLPFFPPAPQSISFENTEDAFACRMKGVTIPAPAYADSELSRIVLKACAYKQTDRYATADEMREDLTQYLKALPDEYEQTLAHDPAFRYGETKDSNPINEKTNSIFGTSTAEATNDNESPTVSLFEMDERDEDTPVEVNTPDDDHEPEEQIKNEALTADETEKKPKWWIICAAAVAVIAGLALLWGILGSHNHAGKQSAVNSSAAPTLDVTTAPVASASSTETPTAIPASMPTASPTPNTSPTQTIHATPTPYLTPDPVVTFSNPIFEQAFRAEYGFSQDVHMSDLMRIEELVLTGKGLSDISDIALFQNVKHVNLDENAITDIQPLANLTKLTELSLWNNNVESIAAVKSLTELVTLDLADNKVADISPIANLNKLDYLNLKANRVSNISDIGGLANLTWLRLTDNSISDISALASLQKLETLHLSGNGISDITSLSNLKNLTVLELSDNRIINVSPIKGLTNLAKLDLDYNQISDISPLASLTKLSVLYVGNNNVDNISAIKNMALLKELNLCSNPILDFSALGSLGTMEEIWLASLNITDVSFIGGMNNLKKLYLWDNSITDISPLRSLKYLNVLYLSENRISDISALQELTKLEKLVIHTNSISSISALSNLRSLNYLSISNNKISSVEPLQNLSLLTELFLAGNPIPKDQVDRLRGQLPNCSITF